MFGLSAKTSEQHTVAFSLGEKNYSVASFEDNKTLLFAECRNFADKIPELIRQALKEDIERLHLIGKKCRVVLEPGQYVLLLMDALDMPPEDMAKALRWRLKGLVDYPLNDIVIDVFHAPAHGVAGQRKKVFVAITQLSTLKSKLDWFESAYMEVSTVSIAELAQRNILSWMPNVFSNTVLVIGMGETSCQLQIYHDNDLYLVRELSIAPSLFTKNSPQAHNILLEIQRSMDYCLSELKIPEPQQIIFTPGFFAEPSFLEFLHEELKKEVKLLDLSHLFTLDRSIGLQTQQDCYYSIGGAVNLFERTTEGTE